MPTALKKKVVNKNSRAPLSKPSQHTDKAKRNTFTAAYERTEDGWWVGQVLEVRGALSQGRTLDELRENLQEALTLILECQRDEARRELAGHDVTEEEVVVPALPSL